MDHEVFVPVPAERLRDALADPARVADAIPGFQRDSGTEPVGGRTDSGTEPVGGRGDSGTRPVGGRLKVRIGGHTITYRGTLRVTGRDDGSYAMEGEATEARGAGAVTISLSIRLLPAEGGTTIAFTGTATGDGRIADLPEDAVASAGVRLLARLAENLGAEGAAAPWAAAETASEEAADSQAEPASATEGPEADRSAPEPEGTLEEAAATAEDAGETPFVFDAEVPPRSLNPFGDEEERGSDFGADGFGDEGEPPAEAAHARRTMIGRSAEEVDHAPPRGRYAPVPAPETTTATATLRWAAPAAAAILASAIVAGRLLRRRR